MTAARKKTEKTVAWTEIKATGPADKKDDAVSILISAGSPGVVENSSNAAVGRLIPYSIWDKDVFEAETPASVSSLTAYMKSGDRGKLSLLRKDLIDIGWEIASSPFKDRDWALKWRAGLKPVKVAYKGRTMIIKPSWCKPEKNRGNIIVELDPGMAFGTGGHSTTKMCLYAVFKLIIDNPGLRSGFFDVGTGTGVLAIAAAKLKAKNILGIDIDKVAVSSARKNARSNNVNIKVSSAPLEKIKSRFPLVAANILSGDLIRLAPVLADRLSAGGFLVLSGILREEATKVLDSYRASGLKFVKAYKSKEWAALVVKKP